ncbi:HEAT repeat domain-containing protein [Polaromonas glacialis]|uniref:HEAT repeat domain-containing protein n=1 Tax=Polaromonas glacialis TaxID=866564 RepID=UPI000A510146|nr:HEAT repeat domain-containing protein [Polaromonas glacialis]
MLNTFSDPYLALAFDIGIAAVGMTILLALVIIYLRITMRRNARREAEFIARWRPLLLEALYEETPSPVPELAPQDQLFFLKLWTYLQESLRGPANDRLNGLARQLRCDAAARGFLKKGNRSERLLAILTLGHLRDEASWDALALQATQADRLASLQAARALIKIDPLRGTEWLFPMLLNRRDWDIAQIANFLGEARQAFWLQLANNILKVDQGQWTRALQLADALHLQLSLKSVRFILENCKSAATLVAALHLASDAKLLPAVRYFWQHADWRVRVEVARFLGSFGEEDDIGLLRQSLHDEQWWVRYQAAQSLARLPFFGPQQLSLLRQQTTDGLAIGMLDHVLAEYHGPMA